MKKYLYLVRFAVLSFMLMLMNIPCNGQKAAEFSQRDNLFNNGWKFVRDSLVGVEKPEYNDSKWTTVDLPHDYSIMDLPAGQAGLPGDDGPDQTGPFSKKAPGNGNAVGHVLGGTGWYRKSFTLDKSRKEKTVILQFDGVYMESQVWVNGKEAGERKHGYIAFWYDITGLLNAPGEPNIIAVKVDNVGRNSRWYSGSGIYRNVHLIITDPVHVGIWGAKITTPEVSENVSLVKCEVTMENNLASASRANIVVNIKNKDGKVTGTSVSDLTLEPKSAKSFNSIIEIKNPDLWSMESPAIYTAEIVIKADNKITDRLEQPFGIRSIEFSAEKGFLLNGKPVELKGACVHHDNGLLGSKAFARAEERRVEILKANGFNAIRCSHNPPSEEFLNACDRLGMLAIDEFTDIWDFYKSPMDYARFFYEWWEKDLTDMINWHRNHPSIIMWSIGNEIHAKDDSTRLHITRMLADRVRQLDNTRPVTQAITGVFYSGGWESTVPNFNLMDVCGYNYAYENFEPDHIKHPARIMYSSESFPLAAYDNWKAVTDHSYVIGDFVWTGWDYLGEAVIGNAQIVPASQKRQAMGNFSGFKIPAGVNIFDMQSRQPSSWSNYAAWCGDIDITGEKRPQMLYRDIVWNNSKLEINVHTPIPEGFAENVSSWGWPDEKPSWNWAGSEGKLLQVRVFTKAPHVKLELNGKVIGEKNLVAEDKYIAVFEVLYQPGALKAMATDNGTVVATKILETTGKIAGVKLTADRSQISADRNDLSFIRVEAVDANGKLVQDADIKVKLTVSGNGELVASGNGSPNDMESFNKPVVKTYRGKALAIVRPFAKPGNIVLRAESEGLEPGEITIQVK